MQSVRIVVDIGKSGKGQAEFETNRIAWSARSSDSSLQVWITIYSKCCLRQFPFSLVLLPPLVYSRQGSIHLILYYESWTSSHQGSIHFIRELDNKRLELVWFYWLYTMPPLINLYTRRYHPFSRPLALHLSFPAERHICSPHSL